MIVTSIELAQYELTKNEIDRCRDIYPFKVEYDYVDIDVYRPRFKKTFTQKIKVFKYNFETLYNTVERMARTKQGVMSKRILGKLEEMKEELYYES